MVSVRRRACTALSGGIFALSIAGTLGAAEYPGAIPGSFAVSDQGVAQYSIPIATVPGAGGLQPHLALTYSHTGGNGLAGARWGLSGISAISRCGQTYAQDGQVVAINYSASDRFCLDGERLIAVSGSYGASGTEYRTEIEGFQKVTQSGTVGGGPQSFSVQHGNGLTSYYGATEDSRIQKVGSTAVRIWYLSYTTDVAGNTIQYYYSENGTTGEVVPDYITWTTNTGQSLTPKYKVTISYETRPSDDQRSGYEPGGAAWASTKRISHIRVYHTPGSDSEISEYALAYNSTSDTGRSQLATVTLQGKNTDTLPETLFTVQNGQKGWNAQSSTGRTSGSYPLVGDFNNDGRQDVFDYVSGARHVYLGQASGGLSASAASVSVGTGQGDSLIDYNGDGYSDLFYFNSSNGYWYVAVSNAGASFNTPFSTGLTGIDPIVRDYDGDGLKDLIYLNYTDHIYWRRNTGSGFANEAWLIGLNIGMPWISFWNSHMRTPDFNGDGRDDLILHIAGCAPPPYPPTCWDLWRLYIASGSGYTQIYEIGAGAEFVHTLDANGDGLDDLLVAGPSENNWVLMLSNGAGFSVGTTSMPAISYTSSFIADYDSDGRDDLVRPSGSNTWYIYRAGTGTASTIFPSSYTESLSSTGASDGGFAADITGDGLPEILQDSGGSTWNWHPHKANLPDVVTRFENGLGYGVDVTYQSLPEAKDSSHYIVDSGDVPSGAHIQQFRGPRYVVTDEVHDDGIGGTRPIEHYYDTAWVDRSGRGWMSFDNHVVKDLDNGTYSYTEYNQTWPYAGRTELTQLRRSSDNQVISQSDTTWTSYPYGGTPTRYFVYVSQVESKDWEVGGSANGTHLRTVLDEPTFSTTYGLIESRTVTTTQPGTSISSTAVTDYNPGVNTTYWCLGLPGGASPYTVSTQVTTQPGSASATRTLYHAYNSNCTLNYTIDQSESSGAKQLKTTFTFDGFGNPNVISLDSYDGSAQDRSIDYTFDAFGQFPIKEEIGTVGLYTETTWDYVAGQPATLKGTDGLTTALTYDSFGRLASETGPGVDTTYSYVAYTGWANSVYYVRAYGSDGSYRDGFFDSLNRSVSTEWLLRGGSTWGMQVTEYNGVGQVLKVTQPYVYGETAYWEEYVHDLIGRVTQVTGLKDTGTTTTTYSYLGHTTQVTDPLSHTTTTVSNALGQIAQITDAASGTASYTYKPFGELASLTDAQSNTTVLSYDARGFKIELDDPTYGDDWRYEYDVYGQLIKQWSPVDAGSYPNYPTIELTYDQAGRLYQRFEDEGTTTHFYHAYDYAQGSNGKLDLVEVRNPSDVVVYEEEFTYNSSYGTPAWVRRKIDSVDYYFNMSYDNQARLDVLSYPTVGGYTFQVDYDYDSYGHLSAVKEGGGAFAYYTLNATDALGQEREVTLGNGLKEYRSFYARTGRLNTLLTEPSGGGTDVQSLTLTYDEVGNLKTRDDATIGIGEDFVYDSLNRLTSATVDYQTAKTASYSAAGDINSKTECGSYTYGSRPHLVTGTASCGSMSYDANSRMVTRGSGEIDWYTYDLPSKIDDPTDTVYSQFWYGPDRARIKQYQSDTGATITYVGELFEYEDAATDTARYYVHTGSRAVAMVERVSGANTTQYLHRDQQGSVTKVTSSGGSVTQALAYDAWGLRRNAGDWSPLASPFAGSHETERGYTGHEHLDNVGLIHMNGRVQDPTLGRFVSADPFVQAPFNTQSHNRFSYVWNNPASYTDPSGFICWLGIWGDCGGNAGDDLGEEEDDDLCDATCMNDRAIVNWNIEEAERIADQRYLEELQGRVLITGMEGYTPGFVPPSLPSIPFAHETAEMVAPGYDLGTCISSQGDCGPAGWVLGMAGVIPGGKWTTQGIEGAIRGAGKLLARSTMATAQQIGRAGEAAVRGAFDIGPATRIVVNGAARIPDGLTATVLSEVKNVRALSYSRQLRDYAAFAADEGLQFDLYVRPNTVLSAPLQQAWRNGEINVRYIPGL